MSDWVNTVAPSLEQRTESNGGKCSQLLLQRPQLPSYHSSSHGRHTFTLHVFFPASNAPHWTVCHIYRGCQWMFTSHALSVDLCRLKASKALLLVMVFSDSEIIWKCLVWICHEASSAKPATRQAAQNRETPLTHINSGTATSGNMTAGRTSL